MEPLVNDDSLPVVSPRRSGRCKIIQGVPNVNGACGPLGDPAGRSEPLDPSMTLAYFSGRIHAGTSADLDVQPPL